MFFIRKTFPAGAKNPWMCVLANEDQTPLEVRTYLRFVMMFSFIASTIPSAFNMISDYTDLATREKPDSHQRRDLQAKLNKRKH